MNDYKELIETLRNGTKSPLHVNSNGFMAFDVGVVNTIADAIEQLLEERENLIYVLQRFLLPLSPESCSFCAHRKAPRDSEEFKENCDVCMEAQHYCCWEYGGIPESLKQMKVFEEYYKKKLDE